MEKRIVTNGGIQVYQCPRCLTIKDCGTLFVPVSPLLVAYIKAGHSFVIKAFCHLHGHDVDIKLTAV